MPASSHLGRRLGLLGVAISSGLGLVVAQQSPSRVLPSVPDDASAPSASVFTFRPLTAGNGFMTATALALDAQGDVFVTGVTGIPNLPGLAAAFQKAPNGDDAYVIKFDPSGRVLWSTYLGGNDRRSSARIFRGDTPEAIAVDPQGQVSLVGFTSSTDFPTVNAILPQPLVASGTDGFITKLSADGSRLIYSTYLGAPDGSSFVTHAIAGPSGETWIGASSRARQLATRADLSGGTGDHLIVKLNPAGTPIWSTRLPGGGVGPFRLLPAFTVDGGGDSYFAAAVADGTDIARLDATGTRLIYQTHLSHPGSPVTDLAIGPDGSAVIVGTSRESLPVINAWQSTLAGVDDAFVGILDAGGRFSTLSYLGGRGDDGLGLLARVASGPFGFAVGFDTMSGDLPTVRPWVAGHVDGPIYTSTDRGGRWFRTGQGTLPVAIEDLAIEGPANILHAATQSGLYLSSDNGETWTLERPDRHTRVTINPRNPRERYISDSFVVSRHDRGQAEGTLLLRALPGANLTVVAVNPLDDSIWVSGNFGVDASYDGGRTWVSRRNGLPVSSNLMGRTLSPDAIAFDPRRPQRVYLGMNDGLYATDDGGNSWRNLTAGLTETVGAVFDVNAIAVDNGEVPTIYAGTGRGLIVSRDEGATWSVTLPGRSIVSVAIDAVDPTRAYAGVDDAEGQAFVWRSSDRGRTWQPGSGEWQMRRFPRKVLVHPLDPVRVYAVSGYYNYLPYLTQFAAASATMASVRPLTASGGDAAAYRATLATYLTTGSLRDLAIAPTGDIVALIQTSDGFSTRPAEFAIVRFGR